MVGSHRLRLGVGWLHRRWSCGRPYHDGVSETLSAESLLSAQTVMEIYAQGWLYRVSSRELYLHRHQRTPTATTRMAELVGRPPLLSHSAHSPTHPAPSGLAGQSPPLPEKR